MYGEWFANSASKVKRSVTPRLHLEPFLANPNLLKHLLAKLLYNVITWGVRKNECRCPIDLKDFDLMALGDLGPKDFSKFPRRF